MGGVKWDEHGSGAGLPAAWKQLVSRIALLSLKSPEGDIRFSWC